MLNCTISARSNIAAAVDSECTLFFSGSKFEFISESTLNSSDRTSVQNRLIFVNHFLSIPVPFPLTSLQVNKDDLMREVLDNCTAQWSGHVPSMMAVDYWSIGNITHVAHEYNRDHILPDATR